ncbi:MAG: DUF106 domain-containing protein [Halobacteria archaeon]
MGKRKAKRLIEENQEFESILENLVEKQEEKGEIEWKDVNTDITSGQWGRLIGQGVLEDSKGEGFVVDDLEGVKELLGLKESSESADIDYSHDTDVEDIDTSWSLYDKGAALIGLFFIVFGYRDAKVQAVIGEAVNILVLPLEFAGLRFYHIVLILATITGLYSSYLQKYLMDWDWISAQQEKVQEIQSELKEAKLSDDDERADELQKEQKAAMSEQMKMFKMQFKPSVWIMVITIPLFIWLYWMFTHRAGNPPAILQAGGTMPMIHMPFVGDVKFSKQVIGFLPIGQAWFVWYILCSFGFGQIMRKVLGVNPTS